MKMTLVVKQISRLYDGGEKEDHRWLRLLTWLLKSETEPKEVMKPAIKKIIIVGAVAMWAVYAGMLYDMDPRCISFRLNE